MPPDIKLMNRAAVLTQLLLSSPTTRSSIAEFTGLSGATVTRTVDGLIGEGIVRELAGSHSEGRGRPPIPIEVVAEHSYTVGVDLGAANTRLVVADLLGDATTVRRTETPADLSASGLAVWLAEFIRSSSGSDWLKIDAIAVGLPGAVHSSGRRVTNAPHLPQVEDPDFLSDLERDLGKTVEIDNDANYALLGELHFGAARRSPNSVMLTLGAGLGGGVAINGRLLRGPNGLVGEFGSLPIGPLGSRLEHLVTGRGIMLRAGELGLQLESPGDIFTDSDNPTVKTLRLQFEQALLIALTAATVSCDPDTIVLGGRIADALAGRTHALEQALHLNLGSSPRVAIAELGDLSGALGASVQSLHLLYGRLGVPATALSRVPARRPFDRDDSHQS